MIVYFKNVDNVFSGNDAMGKFHKVVGNIEPIDSPMTQDKAVKVPIKHYGYTMYYSIELKNVIIYDFKRYYDNASASLQEEL